MSEQALRVLDKAIVYAFACDGSKRKPGRIIQSLSAADREALKELTSDDTMNQRPVFLERTEKEG